MGTQDLRKGRYSLAKQIYSLTFVTYQRSRILSFGNGAIVARQTLANHIVKDHELMCWVIMPDHMHLVMRLGHSESLIQFVQTFKATTSRKINQHRSDGSKIWQDGYFDRAIRKEEDLLPIARYIVANPIRAGLVKSVRNYPLWNAIWL